VTASDMDTIFSTVTVTDTSVFGTIGQIPAGLNRKFEILCYDDNMNLTYQGEKIADVQAGVIMTLNIILYPVSNTGTVIITGSFSPFPPSDEKIVFMADYQGTYDIYIMNTDASNISQITNSSAEDWYPQISPDRTKVIFCRRENGTSRPYIMNIDGSNVQPLNVLPNSGIGFCSWSPDGNKLALHSNLDGDNDIFVYDFNTEIVTQIVFNSATDWVPEWSNDGTKIIFFSDMQGTFRVYTINPDGSNLSLLTNNMNTEERAARYSPDGTMVAMTGRNTYAQWGIFRVDANGTNFFEILNTSGVNEQYPVWSPNSDKIMFCRFDGSSKEHGIYLVNPDGSGFQTLLDTEYYNENKPHWR